MSEILKRTIENKIEDLNAVLNKFKSDAEQNPYYAFEWGDAAFEAAGKLRPYSIVEARMKKGCTLEEIEEETLDELRHRAKHPRRSTSDCSNIISRYELAAWAEIFETLQYIKRNK